MGRKLAVVLTFAIILFGGRRAQADIIVKDWDYWQDNGAGVLIPDIPQGDETDDEFKGIDTDDNIFENGLLRNWVYYNGQSGLYTYLHKVKPFDGPNSFFGTAFTPAGFTGIAGWDFEDSDDANGCGGPAPSCGSFDIGDFFISGGFNTPLGWTANDFSWDEDERIRFFYVSTKPPTIKNYHLTGQPGTGTAESYAPTPEPGSLMLLGSGVAALYGAVRRRNQTP
jgi:hypothetical protein